MREGYNSSRDPRRRQPGRRKIDTNKNVSAPEQGTGDKRAISVAQKVPIERGQVPFVDVSKNLYRRVLELQATIAEAPTRRWQIVQVIFEDALRQLDAEGQGVSITYAALMPAREDGIHALYEQEMRGTPPWPFTLEGKAYLGSTTLAGTAAMLQRTQIWDDQNQGIRGQVMVDDFERCACAHPVLRAGCIAGVLIVSSTQPRFFRNPAACQAVIEYAQLLALGFNQEDFHSVSQLRLRPMPDLRWQRAEIGRTYVNRVIACARERKLAFAAAQEYIRREMEAEFEQWEQKRMEEL